MKKTMILAVASLMALLLGGCSSAFFASAGMYDDMYATHNTTAIEARKKAEADARKAEAEARRAEAEARRAEAVAAQAQMEAEAAATKAQWNAEVARLEADIANGTAATNYSVDANGLIIAESAPVVHSYNSVLADNYQSAYARRLMGFQSASYRMPSSYYNLRYGGSYSYVTAYDPAYYNIMVSGDQVWVEPKYITSMFGTWGATNATAAMFSPWYYGWSVYDPWYYSSWGYPRYSWYDWNWNICYSGGWGLNLWWGWGGYYHPSHYYNSPYYWNHYWHDHYHHYYNHYHPHYSYRPPYPPKPSKPHHNDRYYGSRGNNQNGNAGRPSYNEGRGTGRATPYRSPNNGNVYGNNGVGGSRGSATVTNSSGSINRTPGSVSRGSVNQGSVNRGAATTSRGSSSTSSSRQQGVQSGSSSSNSRGSAYRGSQSSQQRSSSYNSGSSSRSSSSSSSSRSSYSSGSSSRGGSYSGGSSSRGGR